MITIFWPFGLRLGVMVKWSKIFDCDHGQNFKIALVKWSKFVIVSALPTPPPLLHIYNT